MKTSCGLKSKLVFKNGYIEIERDKGNVRKETWYEQSSVKGHKIRW